MARPVRGALFSFADELLKIVDWLLRTERGLNRLCWMCSIRFVSVRAVGAMWPGPICTLLRWATGTGRGCRGLQGELSTIEVEAGRMLERVRSDWHLFTDAAEA